MEKMYRKYKDRAEFFLVYIREAHPVDGWRVPQNDRAGIEVPQPKSWEERNRVAGKCLEALGLTMPALVDDMNDTVSKAYSAWPDRIFVIGRDGKVAYAGGPGPRGFKPDEAEEALRKLVEE